MTTPQLDRFLITGYINASRPPQLAGSIEGFLYWYEGLAGWVQLGEAPLAAPSGTVLRLAVQWLNQSDEAVSGYVELTITKPDGAKTILGDVINQNSWAAPGSGWAVQFEPVALDQVGMYSARAVLNTMGQPLDAEDKDVVIITPLVLYEYYTQGGNEALGFDLKDRAAQVFTPLVPHRIRSVKLCLHRVGLPGIITASIRSVDESGFPGFASLCSGTTDGNTLTTSSITPEWREISLGEGYNLIANVKYAVVISSQYIRRFSPPDEAWTDYVIWRATNRTPTIPPYPRGYCLIGSDYESSWTMLYDAYWGAYYSALFEEWGDPI